MSEISSPSPSAGHKGFPFRIRIEARLKAPPRWYPFVISLGAIILALIIGGLFLALAGGNPIRSYAHIASASFGSWGVFSDTIVKAIPLILVGLACAVAFRMRLWNIGAEGQFFLGAFGASAVVLIPLFPAETSPWIFIPATLIAGTLAGALWGFIPGFLIIISFSIYSYFYCKNRNFKRVPPPTFKELIAILREGFWALMLPVLIFGGIFSGVFTANEAAVVACVYSFIVELFIHKDMKFMDVKKVVVSSAVTSATLLIIVAGASAFGRYLTLEQIPSLIADAVVSHIHTPWMFLLVVNIMLLIVGMFMDIISATLILAPILLPILPEFHISSLHFGLLMTVNLGIGYCTPPLGVSLYITGALVNRGLIYVTRAVMPFLAIQVAILMLLTYWPDLVLFLPSLFYHIR